MASSYTSRLKLERQTSGENSGTWGDLVNYTFNRLDAGIDGWTNVNVAGSTNVTLTSNNSTLNTDDSTTDDELHNRTLELFGTLTGNINVFTGDVENSFTVFNNTTGSYTLTFGPTTGTGVALTQGAKTIVYSDGSTMLDVMADLGPVTSTGLTVGNGAASGVLTSSGAYDLTLNTNAGSNSGEITITDAANGNITLSPNGTGEVVVGSGSAAGDITSSGAYDLIIDTNEGTNAGNITLSNGANGDITFTNNGTGVVKFNDAAYYPEANLAFDATQDWDVQASPVAKVTLTDNVTFDAPSNPTTGQFISILCIQDGTGSRTIAWNAVFEFTADTAPTATTTGDKADLFNFRYNGAKWLSVGSTLDLAVA